MDKCHAKGCHGHGAITWPLLCDITLCGHHYDNPPPEFATLVAESKAPPDDFDIPDEFDRPDGMWETKEGEWIPYEELEDSHLLNIVRMLERKHPGRLIGNFFGLPELKAEAARRGL